MGLLGRVMRSARSGAEGLAEGANWNMPILSALTGAGVGAAGGAAMNPGDPMQGAMIGAGLGAGVMGAGPAMRTIGYGMREAAEEMSAPQRVASQLLRIAQREGPQAMQGHMQQLRMQDPQFADEVMQILMQAQ